ncbi:MAG: hypothetical protein ACNA78_10060 [Balneolaceae bacterium]
MNSLLSYQADVPYPPIARRVLILLPFNVQGQLMVAAVHLKPMMILELSAMVIKPVVTKTTAPRAAAKVPIFA